MIALDNPTILILALVAAILALVAAGLLFMSAGEKR